jgi:hypothetical protein
LDTETALDLIAVTEAGAQRDHRVGS